MTKQNGLEKFLFWFTFSDIDYWRRFPSKFLYNLRISHSSSYFVWII